MVFLGLTAAYDTVWHISQLDMKSAPKVDCESSCTTPWNRWFRVHMRDAISAWKHQTNGLPQGSMLAPTLFNFYTNDLPLTQSQKFIYADNICCGTQACIFIIELEEVLNEDIAKISDYCNQWPLQLSMTKTVSSVFHLRKCITWIKHLFEWKAPKTWTFTSLSWRDIGQVPDFPQLP